MSRRLLALFSAHRLSPAQRRVARYIVEHPPRAALLSSTTLAAEVGVSQPTVTRMATALGLDGYRELQTLVRAALWDRESDGEGENKLQAAVAEEIRNLLALRERLADPGPTRRLAEHLATSPTVPVVGFRVSAPVAAQFVFFAAKLHPDVRAITQPGTPALEALLQARHAGATWLLGIALPRRPRETIEALRYARELGFRIGVLTDRDDRNLAFADETLVTEVGSQLVFDSLAAPFVQLAALLESMADAAPGRTAQWLEDFERLAKERRLFTD